MAEQGRGEAPETPVVLVAAVPEVIQVSATLLLARHSAIDRGLQELQAGRVRAQVTPDLLGPPVRPLL
jgi:hypothetical protein